MIRAVGLCLMVAAGGVSQPQMSVRVSDAIRGGAADGDTIYTWGDRLLRWQAPELRAEVLARGPFGEGGCLVDFNNDGRTDVVLHEGRGLGLMVWFEAPAWRRHVIDREIEMHDCIAAELFGRRGLLMIHRYSQVRFYEPSGVRDIYSIYTPSRQGGLALADIDGDGHTDIICGNYWIQSPAAFELPWRLFAINTISEQTNSALFRMAWTGGLVVSQGEMKPGRLLLFRKPSQPREQWPATVLADDLAFPHGLLVRGAEILVAENDGSRSRLLHFTFSGKRTILQTGIAAHAMLPVVGGFVAIGARAIHLWRR